MRIKAHTTLTTSAPAATAVRPSGDGATGLTILVATVTIAAIAGTRINAESTLPAARRRGAGQATATYTRRLIAVSSRKSAESAKSDAEPMDSAAKNSTKKYARFSSATARTAWRMRSVPMGAPSRKNTPHAVRAGCNYFVELRGIEPLTFALRTRRSTN